jgi:hypothetical protein
MDPKEKLRKLEKEAAFHAVMLSTIFFMTGFVTIPWVLQFDAITQNLLYWAGRIPLIWVYYKAVMVLKNG